MIKDNLEQLLLAENLHKTFHSFYEPIHILKGIHLEVSMGESVAILGRSGEGKSTLLHILGTLDDSTDGSLSIAGEVVSIKNRARIRNHNIGFVFQAFHLLEDYSVLENVLMPARIARKDTHPGSKERDRALNLLAQVGLEHRLNSPAKFLSGGEKQRTALARALCNDPKIIFADEPSGNLDRSTAQQIHQLLFQFSQQPGKALILVTHDQDLAKLCSKVYYLKEGKLIAFDDRPEP